MFLFLKRKRVVDTRGVVTLEMSFYCVLLYTLFIMF